MIYFTSDPHFFHYNIIEYSKRPIPHKALSRKEAVSYMNELLIRNWNSKISPADEVYVLGDFAFGGKEAKRSIINRLNGIKYLIRGNHDDETDLWWLENGFEWVKDYYVLRVHDSYVSPEGKISQFHQPIVLMHFPILSWDGLHHGSWHLHGHTHGTLRKEGGKRMDVGVDTNNLFPYEYEDIKKYMKKLDIGVVDHHKPK